MSLISLLTTINMSTESNLRIEENLNKKNFESQEFILRKILKSKEIFEYVESDVIGEFNKKLEYVYK